MPDTIWIHYSRPRPHWYRLDAGEQQTRKAGWATVAKISTERGALHLGSYHIRGQHDFQTVDIWRFGSPEVAFDHWSRLTAEGYNEFFAFSNNVGLSLEEVIP
jgi:hypothetical protein